MPDALAQSTLALGSGPPTRAAPLTLVVRFDRDLEGYVARVEASGSKQGTRELRTHGADCRTLADAVAVVLAVLSDLTPLAATTPAPEGPATPLARTPAPAPPLDAPAAQLALALETGFAYGLLGEAFTGTATVGLRGRYGAAALELGGLWATPHFESVAPGVIEVGLLGGTALGCAWFGSGKAPELGGCGGVGLGTLSGSGHGFDTNDAADIFWLAGLGGVATRLPLDSRWTVSFSLFVVLPFRSPSFLIGPTGHGFRSSPAAALFRFGPEYRFW